MLYFLHGLPSVETADLAPNRKLQVPNGGHYGLTLKQRKRIDSEKCSIAPRSCSADVRGTSTAHGLSLNRESSHCVTLRQAAVKALVAVRYDKLDADIACGCLQPRSTRLAHASRVMRADCGQSVL
jgi:hypothetical protein